MVRMDHESVGWRQTAKVVLDGWLTKRNEITFLGGSGLFIRPAPIFLFV